MKQLTTPSHLSAADAPLLGVLGVQSGVRAVDPRRDLVGDDERGHLALHLGHLRGLRGTGGGVTLNNLVGSHLKERVTLEQNVGVLLYQVQG